VQDVAVVDHVAVATRRRSAARQGEDVGAAEEALEAVVVDAQLEAVADQARRHGVEHLAQDEAAARGHQHGGLVEVGGALRRQRAKGRALELDRLAPARVAAPDQLGQEAAVGVEVGEVARAAQEQRLVKRLLEVAMMAFDGAVLVRHAAVVPARRHAVVRAQRLVAPGQVGGGRRIEVAERGGERVGAVLARRAAQSPKRVLQPVRQGGEALAAQDDLGVLPARAGQGEMVEPMRERRAGDGDRERASVGEVGQGLGPGRVRLTEDDLALGPVQRLPAPDAPFQGAALSAPVALGMAPLELLEDGDRPQVGHGLEQRHDLGGPDDGQRVRPGLGPTVGSLLRGQPGIALEPACGALAEAGLGGGGGLRMRLSEPHVPSHLLVGDPCPRHDVLFWQSRTSSPWTRRDQRGEGLGPRRRWGRPTRPLPNASISSRELAGS
jgi:hypothetical protein